MSKMIVFLLFIFLAPRSSGEDLIIRAGYLLDTQEGKWNKNQVFLIKNGRINKLNPQVIPKNVRTLDFSNNYLIPGLIDAHTHLFLDDSTFGKKFAKGLLAFCQSSSEKERMTLARRRSQTLLKMGFTSVRDLGNSGKDFHLEIDKSELRFYSSGPGHSPLLGQFPLGTSEDVIYGEYARLDEKTFQGLKKDQRSTLKIYADEDPNETLTSIDILKRWANKAHDLKLKVAAHAVHPRAIQNAIEAKVDSIEHGTFVTEAQLKLMSQKDIHWVPTTGSRVFLNTKLKVIQSEHVRHELELICKNIPIAHKLGVKITFGSDYYYSLEKWGLNFGEATLEALLYLHECGLTPIDVLRAATLNPAKLLGVMDLGQLKEGYMADFVVLENDPLSDLSTLKKPVGVYLAGAKIP
jgi:imidazolonepropionase-like amidohydrolase